MRLFFVSLIASALLLTGCTTAVTVTSVPPGATVYARGSGRPSFKWEKKGVTTAERPLVYTSAYSADKLFGVWEDGRRTPEIRIQHIFDRDVSVELVRPGK